MYNYKFTVTKVVDGDTVYGVADLGFNISFDVKLRLARINTPELRTKDVDEKARAYEAKAEVKKLLDAAEVITITTTGKGKYGRWIAELYVDGENLNDHLVKNDLAEYVEY